MRKLIREHPIASVVVALFAGAVFIAGGISAVFAIIKAKLHPAAATGS